MEEKKIIIHFNRGVMFEIPAIVIAKKGAEDLFDKDTEEYQEAVNKALDDEFLLFDWIWEIDWNEIAPHAKLVLDPKLDLEEEWNMGNAKINSNW